MSPAITDDTFNTSRDGQALEEVSDAIDTVNVLKANLYSDEAPKFAHGKTASEFRQYEDACSRVKNFYQDQHTNQTYAYNVAARKAFHSRVRARMTIWQAMEKLNTLIDESDPDTDLSQIEHLLQSAEAIRRDGKPRWFQLTGLIHDLGKLLYFFDAQGQWDVVGDTFPVGCAFDEDSIIYPGSFENNPDMKHEVYSTKYGVYAPGCGMDEVLLSWGHDEYLYNVCKEQSTLPEEALGIIRYHSFYPWHTAGGYGWMMNEKDEKILKAVKAFNPYDLYSKADGLPDVQELKAYYMDLINEFFPPREGETERILEW
ncbi:inositol oxygenase [Piedraia hortae CBS 480.64]|uniref:Inositol oxygenase n=1 Tax=Piedraia hortae CBS 480.64 TaxID=1314780 RepID=A0A6A7C5K0_9PEZI|nr:inositol oxygenase [Piedraia hortae CBS 480.64]